MYKRLRHEAPVYRSQTGEYIITSYELVKQLLKDPTCMAGNRLNWVNKSVAYLHNRDEDFRAISQAMQSFLLFKNPPEHTAIRKFVSNCWSDRDVADLVTANIHELLNNFNGSEIDLVNDFAKNLPALTISRILGLPPTDYAMLKSWASSLIKSLDLYISMKDLVLIHQAAKDFIAYFRDHAAKVKADKRHGLINTMMEVNAQRGHLLTDEQLVSVFIFLFVAGEETTVGLISTGIYNLLRHPGQWKLLCEQPELSQRAVDELLRYDSPVHLLGRIAGEPLQLNGLTVPAGSTLTLVVAAANRDEDFFDRGDELDIIRTPNRHLAFGTGIHVCLGDWLAELQGRLALENLAARFPHMRLLSSSVEWNNNLAVRSLKRLPVQLTPFAS